MQFQIPQFIETESKIVGPLTLKQFAYIGVTGLIVFLLFYVLKTFIWIFLSVIIVALGMSMAFVKYNGQKMPVILKSIFKYIWKPKFYLWKSPKVEPKKLSREPKATLETAEEKAEAQVVQDISHPEKPRSATEVPIKETTLETAKKQPLPAEVPEAQPGQSVPVPAALLESAILPTEEEEAREQKQAFIEEQVQAESTRTMKGKKTEPRGLGALWLKLSTTTKALTKREKKPPTVQEPTGPKSKEIFEMFRKMTGEKEVARRIDYR